MATVGNVRRRILVVDDDPLVADSIRRMLEFDRHEVRVAGNGDEALAAFANSNFDLTLVDYEMPKMKGDRLALAIKAIAPTHPIVMFSGYAEAVRGAESTIEAVDFVLGKPFDLQELRRTIARFFPSP
jgi:CheY-like chemotaxis protein